jgi:hypothetical protein
LGANNFKSFSADGPKEVIDVEHGEKSGHKTSLSKHRQESLKKGTNPRFLRSSSLKKYFIPLGVER